MANSYAYPYLTKINKRVVDSFLENPNMYNSADLAGLTPTARNGSVSDGMVGGSKFRNHQSKYVKFADGEEYYQPGNTPIPPYLNMDENRYMNKLNKPYNYLQGTGRKPPKDMAPMRHVSLQGGEINKGEDYYRNKYKEQKRAAQAQAQAQAKAKAKKNKKGIPGHILSGALDVLPAVAAAAAPLALTASTAGTAAPAAALLAPVVGYSAQKARDAIREKTGYGKPRRTKALRVSRVGAQKQTRPKLAKLKIKEVLEDEIPEPRDVLELTGVPPRGSNSSSKTGAGRRKKSSSSRAKGAGNSGGARSGGARSGGNRATIVKQVMQEKGLSLPQASSYVKQHKLY